MASAVSIQWYVRGRILYMHYPETVTYEMLEDAVQRTLAFMDESATPIDVIVDARDVRRPPVNMIRIKKAVSALIGRNNGWYVILTDDPKIKFLAVVVAQFVNPNKYQVFSTMGEAVAFLSRQDPTIDWSGADPFDLDETEPSSLEDRRQTRTSETDMQRQPTI